MKKKNKDKKLKIFKAFSQNLDWFKEHQAIKIEPDIPNGYICPVCLEMFDELSLQSTSKNPLTIEHVPPESLGGKSRILTCKECNSKSGHQLDSHLVKSLLETDFHSFLPNSMTKAVFELNGNKINGTVDISDKGVWNLRMSPKHSNPSEASQFVNDFTLKSTIENSFFEQEYFGPQIKSPNFTLKPRDTAEIRRAEVALLRIAYLYLYSVFGNAVLLNATLGKIRKQILNPAEDILKAPYWIKYEFSDEWDGINMVREPKELRCFLIIFKLKTKSGVRKFNIALPGLSEPDLNIYENIGNLLCTDGTHQNIILDHINDKGFLQKKEDTFAYLGYWRGIAK